MQPTAIDTALAGAGTDRVWSLELRGPLAVRCIRSLGRVPVTAARLCVTDPEERIIGCELCQEPCRNGVLSGERRRLAAPEGVGATEQREAGDAAPTEDHPPRDAFAAASAESEIIEAAQDGEPTDEGAIVAWQLLRKQGVNPGHRGGGIVECLFSRQGPAARHGGQVAQIRLTTQTHVGIRLHQCMGT
jgi:hypothetical protein